MLKMGPVTDFRSYADYVPRFAALLGRVPACAELHLVGRDMATDGATPRDFRAFGRFMRDQGVATIAVHTLDDVLNDLILHLLADAHPGFRAFRPCARTLAEAEKELARQFEGIAAASDGFGDRAGAVIHQGIILPSEALAQLDKSTRRGLRAGFFEVIDRIHDGWFRPYARECRLQLENSPPYRGESTDEQHFTDQILADIAPRLRDDEVLVMDVSHTFMGHTYLTRGAEGVFGLDLAAEPRADTAGYDNSVSDVAAVGGHIGWVHMNDCNGLFGENEGLPVGLADSVVDWPALIAVLERIDAPIILEIRHVEKDFGLFEHSLGALRAYGAAI